MDMETLIGFLTIGIGVVGSYVKMHSEVERLKSEVNMLRERERDIAAMIKELQASVYRIEIALVRAGLIETE